MHRKLKILLPAVILWSAVLANQPSLKQDLTRRRQAVMEKMDERGVLILFSAEPRRYSRDVDYEFRQENNLYYLTGIRQAGITLVLMPHNSERRELLFLPERNERREIWTGKMLSPAEATEISGIKNVRSASELETFIDSALRTDKPLVFLLVEEQPGLRGNPNKEFKFAKRLQKQFLGIEIKDASQILHPLRLVKSDFEIEQLRRAVEITVDAHLEAMKSLRPDTWEYQIEALIESCFKRNNAFDWAFPSIVASGPNALTLHYDASQRQAQRGELMLIDIGASYNYYAADVTRTIPVGGKYNKEQAEIYQIVLDAQNAAMSLVKPGAKAQVVHEKAVEIIKDGLFRLGLITDQSGDQYRIFLPHFTVHWVGLDVHDVGPRSAEFRPGMVLTVEPGIYVRENAADKLPDRVRSVIEKYKNIGVRIEDDLLVTESGCEILSKRAPREIKEIETMMQGKL